jgi:hypothetical protein
MPETIVSFGALVGFSFRTGILPECSIVTPMQHDLALYADLVQMDKSLQASKDF